MSRSPYPQGFDTRPFGGSSYLANQPVNVSVEANCFILESCSKGGTVYGRTPNSEFIMIPGRVYRFDDPTKLYSMKSTVAGDVMLLTFGNGLILDAFQANGQAAYALESTQVQVLADLNLQKAYRFNGIPRITRTSGASSDLGTAADRVTAPISAVTGNLYQRCLYAILQVYTVPNGGTMGIKIWGDVQSPVASYGGADLLLTYAGMGVGTWIIDLGKIGSATENPTVVVGSQSSVLQVSRPLPPNWSYDLPTNLANQNYEFSFSGFVCGR